MLHVRITNCKPYNGWQMFLLSMSYNDANNGKSYLVWMIMVNWTKHTCFILVLFQLCGQF